nr:hypothetical protein [uncultured Roseateles sp.]
MEGHFAQQIEDIFKGKCRHGNGTEDARFAIRLRAHDTPTTHHQALKQQPAEKPMPAKDLVENLQPGQP